MGLAGGDGLCAWGVQMLRKERRNVMGEQKEGKKKGKEGLKEGGRKEECSTKSMKYEGQGRKEGRSKEG